MVTLAIAAILLTLGVPGMTEFVRDVRRDARVSDLVVALNYCRSEAIKLGHEVTLCPSADGATCVGKAEWEHGWIVFADVNSNGVVNGGETILRVWGAIFDDGTIRGGKKRITYQSTGFSLGYNDTLRICDVRGVEKAKSVIVSMQGRARVVAGASQCL